MSQRFSDLSLDPVLMQAIEDLGFTEPTPIQDKALPPGLAGRDVLACAMTGSGKTAAFALPILQRLHRQPGQGTRALILTPTRELAAQVEEHLNALGRHTQVTSAAVFGGVKPGPQERALRAGVNVVVATPGRLLDHMQQPWCRLDGVEVLVLDEADRMLDMGFLPDVKRILRALPAQRQNLLFSATLPAPIVSLSRELLHDPVRIDVERRSAPATGVRQTVLPVPEQLKPALLLELLRRDEVGTALVFTRTKHRANRLAEFLVGAGVPCERIHGNRSQPQREAVLASFKSGNLRVLVATDIAARGIDVEALPFVVNFDVPVQADDYIHRVGRTARASSTGDALTLASPDEASELAAIERAVGKSLQRRRIDGFDYNARSSWRLEIPIGECIAAIRARRAEERARSAAKADRRGQGTPLRTGRAGQGTQWPRPAAKPRFDPRSPQRATGNPRPRAETGSASSSPAATGETRRPRRRRGRGHRAPAST
ncbi:MAG: DEAD/DEAH box helicase [Pseudomonadota bacterium]